MTKPSSLDIKYMVWKMQVKERDNYTCMACARHRDRDKVNIGAYRTGLEFVGDGRTSDYDLEQGGTFCRKCALSELRVNNLGGRKPGFSHSEETRKKMGQSKIGVPKSPEHRKKISDALLARRKTRPAL